MSPRLRDKVAIFTGAASGIGAATAQMFVERGAQVVGFDRNPSALPGERLSHAVVDVSQLYHE